MRRTALLAACLLAATPALAQQRTVPNPLGDTSGTTAAPAPPGSSTAAAPSTSPATPAAAPRASTTVSTTGANQFTTEATAQAHCPGDTVVWENPRSKAYHLKGDRYFGHTKTGAYMCKRDADAAGKHASGTRRAGGGKKPAHPART